MSYAIVSRLAAAALAFTAACYPEQIVFPDALGSVTTLVDSGDAALRTARVFALPDTVVALKRGTGTIGHADDHTLVARVRQNFLARGWIETRNPAVTPPDVVILLAGSTRVEVGVAYTDWYGAWGYLPYWGGAVDPSLAWGAPVGAIPYAYQAGTLIVTMVDVRPTRTRDDGRIPLLWAAALDGVLTGESTLDRALDGIDQAFVQSPYLRIP